MLERSEASQGGGVTYSLLHLPALRFFVVLLALSSEGLLQNDKNLYFRGNILAGVNNGYIHCAKVNSINSGADSG